MTTVGLARIPLQKTFDGMTAAKIARKCEAIETTMGERVAQCEEWQVRVDRQHNAIVLSNVFGAHVALSASNRTMNLVESIAAGN